MEMILASWWKRILIFSGLFVISYLLSDYAFRMLIKSYFLIYYYYDSSIAIFISLLISSVLIERFRSQNYYFTFGLTITRSTLREILFSFLLVSLPFAFLSVLLYLLNFNNFTSFEITRNFIYFTSFIFLYALIEELIFRGIIFQALIDRFGIVFTAVFTSLIFSLFHIYNGNFSTFAFINTFLAGMVLGLMYYQTRSLYLPIFFHFFWNFLQKFLLNSNISGYSFGYSVSNAGLEKLPIWLFGGNYGIEGGLAGTICLITALALTTSYVTASPYINSKLLKRHIFENIL